MNLSAVEQRIQAGESQHLDFKTNASNLDSIGATLCAFLNGDGGSILIGVGDDGHIHPVPQAESAVHGIEDFLRARLVPLALWSVTVETTSQGDIIEVAVPAGVDRPYLFGDQIYFRRGSQSVEASASEVRALLQQGADEPLRWERQSAPDLELADLDEEEVLRTANSRTALSLVSPQRFGDINQNQSASEVLTDLSLLQYGTLTNAARVLFDPKAFLRLPQTRVRLTRFQTDKGGDFLHDAALEGQAFDLVEHLFVFLQQNILMESRFEKGNLLRETAPDYPFQALREGILNAIIHRDYAPFSGGMSVGIYPNRIEIWNSGHLPKSLKVQDLKISHPSLPFNPDIAHVFYLRGYIEKLGRGTQKIIAECKSLGTPTPVWKQADTGITLTFWSRTADSSSTLSTRQQELLSKLNNGETLVPARYYEQTAATLGERQARRILTELEKAGYLKRQGNGPATVYIRTEKG